MFSTLQLSRNTEQSISIYHPYSVTTWRDPSHAFQRVCISVLASYANWEATPYLTHVLSLQMFLSLSDFETDISNVVFQLIVSLREVHCFVSITLSWLLLTHRTVFWWPWCGAWGQESIEMRHSFSGLFPASSCLGNYQPQKDSEFLFNYRLFLFVVGISRCRMFWGPLRLHCPILHIWEQIQRE